MARTAAAQRDDEGTDLQAVLDEYDKEQAQKGMFKPAGPGVYYGRILPPRTKGLYYVQFGMHFDVGLLSPRLADHRGIGCYRETLGQECILCEMQKRFYFEGKSSGDETKLNLSKNIRAKVRRVVNFVDIKNPSAGVLTWEFPASNSPNRVSVATKIGALFKEWGDITHPTKGYVIKLTYEKKSEFLTCEDVAITSKQTEIPVENWREERKDLEAYAKSRIIPIAKLKELLKEDTDGDDGDGDDDQPPARRRATTTSKPSADDDSGTNPEEVGGDEAEADTPPEEGEDAGADESDPKVQEVLAQLRKAGKLRE